MHLDSIVLTQEQLRHILEKADPRSGVTTLLRAFLLG